MDENYLKHYGVKGMRWGVRRDIKRKSVNAARLTSLQKENSKKISGLNKSISKKYQKLPSSSRPSKLKKQISIEQRKRSDLKRENEILGRYKKHLTKDISSEDIKRGEKHLRNLKIATYGVGFAIGPVGGAIAGGSWEGARQTQRQEAYSYSGQKIPGQRTNKRRY